MGSNRKCSIDGCAKPHLARGYCSAHWCRWKRHGDPLGGRQPQGHLLKLLQETVSSPPADCVLWPYGKDGAGYGRIRYQGKDRPAHRLALELFLGRPIASGLEVAHAPIICNNPSCINPRHLREATPAENCADKLKDGTHHRGERHGQSKLTAEAVLAIRADQRTQAEIASSYGIVQAHVSRIKSGDTWSWL